MMPLYLELVLEPNKVCASYKPKGTNGDWVKSAELLKKNLQRKSMLFTMRA